MELVIFILVILAVLAVIDLIVGVSNDAVNFLNSSLGSKVASRKVILTIAGLGILAGVTFSSGMMEVARKGIFHPENFIMLELLIILVAVMLTDILLLDFFNTVGFPTSTTVSIIFEILGAAVAVSLMKLYGMGEGFARLGEYINTEKVLVIVFGILLSVVIAFTVGAFVQFISRMIFTFEYEKKIKKYGAIWGGAGLTMIVYFILIKGAKGASFLTEDHMAWIASHTLLIIGACFASLVILMQGLISFTKINVLKVVVLFGTFAIAMAFAANDLVNFIGVPLAGFSAYFFGMESGSPFTATMEAMSNPVKVNTLILLGAGLVMVFTLRYSKKLKTVSRTELSLGRQDEGLERFESFFLARALVRGGMAFMSGVEKVLPKRLLKTISKRKDLSTYRPAVAADGETPSFDLVRASVNMMVASALVAFATSLKLPLSTTYVTFMVAMGTSLADGAWDRESAVYRVSGVLAVIGGWFFTAFMAFTVAFIYAVLIFKFKMIALIGLVLFSIFILWKNHKKHKEKVVNEKMIEVYNLKKIKDPAMAVNTSFEQTGKLLDQIADSLSKSFGGLRIYDREELRIARLDSKKIQDWTNIIIANVFKTLRLLHEVELETAQKYSQIISNLQDMAESQKDIALRSYNHVLNNHKGLLEVQVKELAQIIEGLTALLKLTAESLKKDKIIDIALFEEKNKELKRIISKFDKNQIVRVQDQTSKIRLSILYFAYLVGASKISVCMENLLDIFHESMKSDK